MAEQGATQLSQTASVSLSGPDSGISLKSMESDEVSLAVAGASCFTGGWRRPFDSVRSHSILGYVERDTFSRTTITASRPLLLARK